MNTRKRAKFIVSVFIILALFMSQLSVSFAFNSENYEGNLYIPTSSNIARPVIKVKNVDDNYLKISWKKCKNAAYYEVFESSSKDENYCKIGTTTKTYFNDKKVIANETHYYKVRAVSKSGKKSSKFSAVKKGRITFNGQIVLPEGSDIRTIAGSETTIHVYTKNCKNDIEIKTYDPDVIVSIENKKANKYINGNEYIIKVKYAEKELDRVHTFSVFFKFKGISSRFYLNRAYLVTIPPTSAKKFNGIPRFDSIVKIKPEYKSENLYYGCYFYTYDSIIEASSTLDNTADHRSVEAALKTYMELLETPTYDFFLYAVEENEEGGLTYTYFSRDGSMGVSIANYLYYGDLEPCVSIVLADMRYI
ncbi:MAG: hypothetical protein HFE73_04935 [Firmicutes bacterium]|nr:hypothetical protein [Bacillota bacterium]